MIFTPLIKSLSVLIALAATTALLALSTENPGTISIEFQGWQATTTAAVAAGTVIMGAALMFYLGQTISWLTSLPEKLRARRTQAALTLLTRAQTTWMLGDDATTQTLLKGLTPTVETEPMATLWSQTQNPQGPVLQTLTAHPVLGPWACLLLAQHSAKKGNWEACANWATQGHAEFQKAEGKSASSPHLLTLQLKAYMNLNQMAEAAEVLKALTPHLAPEIPPLIGLAIGGPAATGAAVGNPWLKKFQKALGTPNPTLPGYDSPTQG